MTTYERMIKTLTDKGMWPEEAKIVLDLAKPEIEKSGTITWDQPASEYPDPLYAVMGMIVDEFALTWIQTESLTMIIIDHEAYGERTRDAGRGHPSGSRVRPRFRRD